MLAVRRLTDATAVHGSAPALALEVVRRRRDVDVVVTWGERVALPAGLLLRLLPGRPAHVAMLYWFSQRRKALLLRLAQSGIDRAIVRSAVQHRFALDRLGLPEQKVVYVPQAVDTRFWRPLPGPCDRISAVGWELRDYETLFAALRGLDIPCHVAASNRRDRIEFEPSRLPPAVTTGELPYPELRALYASSRFVVVPLLPTDSNQGAGVILEAFAMARPVICSATAGQVGLLEDGVNGVLVPPRDARALRAAVERLWADPELCDRMGAAGRALVEREHSVHELAPRVVEVYAEAVRAI